MTEGLEYASLTHRAGGQGRRTWDRPGMETTSLLDPRRLAVRAPAQQRSTTVDPLAEYRRRLAQWERLLGRR